MTGQQSPQPKDARNNVLYANDLYAVGPHRKVVSPNSLVAVLRTPELESLYPTFISLIEDKEDGPENLKKLFNALATASANNGANSELFWLINVTDERVAQATGQKNMTYSQGSYPHAHIIHGPLPEDYKYGHVIQEKTYTPSPRADFNEQFQTYLYEKDCSSPTGKAGYHRLYIPDDFAESPEHITIICPDFLNFRDFVARADDLDYDILRSALLAPLSNTVHGGGARLVCDDFNSPGIFTLRIQSGDQKHKWFERPQPQP